VTEQVLGGGGALSVDVASLGHELRRLWQENAREGGPITRACTRNLVALCASEAEATRATETIASLAGDHPSRAFVVVAAEDPAKLEAFLTAHCSLRAGGRHVCCEQLTLHVGRDARRRAAGAIVPLLVPDLPVFVWLTGTPSWEDPLLERLLDVSDRLVIDSRTASDPHAFVCNLVDAHKADAWAPGDFEWSRLMDWREAVASLFDEPATRALPSRVERIEVRYGRGGSAVAAALLAGWAQDRVAAARAREGVKGTASATLTQVGEASPSAILSVTLAADDPPFHCTVAFEKGDSGLTSRVDLEDACALPARLPFTESDVARLLEHQLDMPGASPLYERALARAATLLSDVPPSIVRESAR
jgi:glucose-6-phosphate dehydrogenase assembly protein OpcA